METILKAIKEWKEQNGKEPSSVIISVEMLHKLEEESFEWNIEGCRLIPSWMVTGDAILIF